MSGAIVSRQATPSAVALPHQRASLSDRLTEAKAIASAGDLVPKAYRSNPGAVMLAMEWAERNGTSILEAVQGLDIVQGKPFVSAELRRRLASDKGFEFEVLRSDEAVCELQVWDRRQAEPAKRGEPLVVAIDSIPSSLKSKDNWKNQPQAMLFATACRRADRLHVQTAAATVDATVDYIDELPLDAEPTPEPIEAETVEVVEAEEVDGLDFDLITLDDIKGGLKTKGITQGAAVTKARELTGRDDLPNLQAAADDQAVAAALMDWVDQQ